MNQSLTVPAENYIDPEPSALQEAEYGWVLHDLKPLHKKVCSLWAQGEKNIKIAAVLGITPQYVSMLMSQQVCRDYVAKLNDVADLRLNAMFEKSVDVIADTLVNGNDADKLRAARLQMEATKRIGSTMSAPIVPNSEGRLLALAERLTSLLHDHQQPITIQGNTYDAEK